LFFIKGGAVFHLFVLGGGVPALFGAFRERAPWKCCFFFWAQAPGMFCGANGRRVVRGGGGGWKKPRVVFLFVELVSGNFG